MRALFRTALLSVLFKTHGHKFPGLPSAHHRRFSLFLAGKLREAPRGRAFFCCSATMGDGGASMERQFEDFRALLDDSGSVRERIRSVVSEVELVARVMQSNLLLVHHALVSPEVLEKAKVQISTLQALFKQLSDIIGERPGQYYRYHGDWRGETQSVVSSLAFLHWLETENLLTHAEAEEKLGLDPSQFCLDIEDYLIGLCFMSNELPRFVVNQVTAGNYDCPRKVLKFLTDLHAAFRLLNLRNDFLRKKFDSLKYDLRRVEEVYYDVKIRGLGGDSVDNCTEGDKS
ncbi:uncharacterized protein LOC116266346 isoform X3 [Nymphaea colorata]|nr:uncharacterized protein LOC116266346 isoform X1 [Nymphaea colorata]XP_049936767.1 uncharacterized protein LOC116266346 isoform X2 [Nymphaea colorata]XP_049936768.1 uncharacterized protein LOC116266346 isoform X3 [Nymphaea colorata]